MRFDLRALAGALLLVPSIAVAQTDSASAEVSLRAPRPQPVWDDTTKTFFTRRDLVFAGATLATAGVVSIFDPRIARWAAQPSVQGTSSRHHAFETASNLSGETTLTWATVGTYAIGRVTHSSAVADVSLHLIEAQAMTSLVGQAVRGVLGRARPSVDPNKQYSWHWGKGFSKFDYRAFPSLHSAAGFVVAAGLTEELKMRDPSANRWVAPVAYTLALVPGVTRMYLGQHWASDVVAGAMLGTFMGKRVVRYAHTHERTKLDKWLLGAAVLPNANGGTDVSVAVRSPF